MTQTLNLEKGDDLDLSKQSPGLSKIRFGLGWDPAEAGDTYDLDASVAVFQGQDRKHVVFYNNLSAPGIKHSGDDLTGGASDTGPDEEINVDLNEIDGDRAELIVTLYNAQQKGQSLKEVKNAFVQVTNGETGDEIAKYGISDSDMDGAAMHFATLVRDPNDGDWHFKAVGKSLGNVALDGAVAAVAA